MLGLYPPAVQLFPGLQRNIYNLQSGEGFSAYKSAVCTDSTTGTAKTNKETCFQLKQICNTPLMQPPQISVLCWMLKRRQAIQRFLKCKKNLLTGSYIIQTLQICLKLHALRIGLTLEKMSSTLKPNQLVSMSQWYLPTFGRNLLTGSADALHTWGSLKKLDTTAWLWNVKHTKSNQASNTCKNEKSTNDLFCRYNAVKLDVAKIWHIEGCVNLVEMSSTIKVKKKTCKHVQVLNPVRKEFPSFIQEILCRQKRIMMMPTLL